jgi:hypothetical protein
MVYKCINDATGTAVAQKMYKNVSAVMLNPCGSCDQIIVHFNPA